MPARPVLTLLLGDVLRLRRVHPCGDVGKPALEVGDAVHEQHHDVDRRQPQIMRDAHVVAGQVADECARGIEQAHLVSRLDPELLRKWLYRVPSHDPTDNAAVPREVKQDS